MRRTKVSYDLRSYISRPAVLISLIVLIFIGLLSLAMAYSQYANSIKPYHLIFIVFSPDNHEYLGYALNFYGDPIAGVKVYTNESVYISSNDGSLLFNGSIEAVSLNGANVSYLASKYIALINMSTNKATLVVVTPANTKVYFGFSPTLVNYLSTVKGLSEFYVNYSSSYLTYYVKLNKSMLSYNIPFKIITPHSFMLKALTQLNSIYPLIIIYLIFVLIVSQKSNRSIETVLATPMTRASLFISRFISGILPLIISSIIISTVTALIISSLTLYAHVQILLYTSLLLTLGPLISLYSIYYILGILARNSAVYFLISISVYLTLFMLASFVPSVNSFNPLSTKTHIISDVLWLIIPFILGLIYFNRTDNI